MLKLIFPNETHKKLWEKLIKERITGLKMPSSFFSYDNFEDFLKGVNNDINGVEGKVLAHTFFLFDTEKTNEIIGIIQIRHSINHPNLIENGGHIGYGINPKFRKMGYGTKNLTLGLEKIKELNLKIDKVLLICRKDNLGSAKIIENNGGVFERLTKNGNKKRYWIDL